jgi:hypothetical protein
VYQGNIFGQLRHNICEAAISYIKALKIRLLLNNFGFLPLNTPVISSPSRTPSFSRFPGNSAYAATMVSAEKGFSARQRQSVSAGHEY